MKMVGKVLLIIGAVAIVLVIAFMATTKVLIDHNNKSQGKKSETIACNGESTGKALVVYQPSSGTNTTKNIAYQLAKGINSNGYEVTIANPGKYAPNDISPYSIIVFGSPVYASRTSSVLNDYIKRIKDFSGKRVILFTTGMMDDSKQLEELQNQLKNTDSPIAVQFIAGQKNDEKRAYEIGSEAAAKQK